MNGDRAGHWLMLSAPEKFTSLLFDYLKGDLGGKLKADSPSH